MTDDDAEAARWAAFTSFFSSDDEADRKPTMPAAAPPAGELPDGARPSAPLQAPTSATSSRPAPGRRSIYPPVDFSTLGTFSSAGAGLAGPGRRAGVVKSEPTASSSTAVVAPPAVSIGGRTAAIRLKVEPKREEEDEVEIIGESSRPGRSPATKRAQGTAAAADERARRRRDAKVEGTRDGDDDEEITEVGPAQPLAGPSRTNGGGNDFRQSQAERQKAFGRLAALDDEVRTAAARVPLTPADRSRPPTRLRLG